MRSISGTRRLLKWIGNGLLAVMLVWTLVPFYWMVATSLKTDKEIYGYEATLIPRQPTLDAYRRLFAKTPFVKYVRNSTIIAVTTTLASLVLGCLGAYDRETPLPGPSDDRAGPRLLIPGAAGAPVHPAVRRVVNPPTHRHPRGTHPDLPRLHGALRELAPHGLLRSVPLELEEAALVDGCSRLGTLVRIILPMSLPALAVVAFFAFTQAWNEFLYATVFVNSVEVRTITTGLSLFIIEDVFFWGPMMGASFLSAIPPVASTWSSSAGS